VIEAERIEWFEVTEDIIQELRRKEWGRLTDDILRNVDSSKDVDPAIVGKISPKWFIKFQLEEHGFDSEKINMILEQSKIGFTAKQFQHLRSCLHQKYSSEELIMKLRHAGFKEDKISEVLNYAYTFSKDVGKYSYKCSMGELIDTDGNKGTIVKEFLPCSSASKLVWFPVIIKDTFLKRFIIHYIALDKKYLSGSKSPGIEIDLGGDDISKGERTFINQFFPLDISIKDFHSKLSTFFSREPHSRFVNNAFSSWGYAYEFRSTYFGQLLYIAQNCLVSSLAYSSNNKDAVIKHLSYEENREKMTAFLIKIENIYCLSPIAAIEYSILLPDPISEEVVGSIQLNSNEGSYKCKQIRTIEDFKHLLQIFNDIFRPEYVSIENSTIYQLFQQLLSASDFPCAPPGHFPSADLSKRDLKAHVQIKPPPGIYSVKKKEWHANFEKAMIKMNDLTADVMDAITIKWLESKPEKPKDEIIISADDILELRGIKKKISGSGRRGGYAKVQRDEIRDHIWLLDNTWINVDRMTVYTEDEKGRRKKSPWSANERAIIISKKYQQETNDGSLKNDYIWQVYPSPVFTESLLGPGRQTALISTKALNYNPQKHWMEKRLVRYFSYIWRIRYKNNDYLKAISIETILNGIRVEIDKNNPNRTKERFEEALDRLHRDGLIAGWQYDNGNELLLESKGWKEDWAKWKIAVEPPYEIIEYYEEYIKRAEKKKPKAEDNASIDNIGRKLREKRKLLRLTQMQVAEDIGISRSRVSKIEAGGNPTRPEKRKLIKWLE